MRKLILLFLVSVLFASCAIIPIVGNYGRPYEKIVNKNYDATWAQVQNFIIKKRLSVERIDKNSGIIDFSFILNSSLVTVEDSDFQPTNKDAYIVVASYSRSESEIRDGSYGVKYIVFVQLTEDINKTKVVIYKTKERSTLYVDGSTNIEPIICESTGVFETKFLDAIN